MKTKNLHGFFLLTILACFYSCKVGDPIEGQNTFAVENLTDKSVELLYTFSSNLGTSFAGKTYSVSIAPQQANIFESFRGGSPDLTPSRTFEKMVFLGIDKDTLYKMDVIDDHEWILTDSVKDYGYKVGYYHWLYKYTE